MQLRLFSSLPLHRPADCRMSWSFWKLCAHCCWANLRITSASATDSTYLRRAPDISSVWWLPAPSFSTSRDCWWGLRRFHWPSTSCTDWKRACRSKMPWGGRIYHWWITGWTRYSSSGMAVSTLHTWKSRVLMTSVSWLHTTYHIS